MIASLAPPPTPIWVKARLSAWNCFANDPTCAAPLKMATSIVGGCGLVDHLSGIAATSAVIFFISASVSFLEVTHGRLLDARPLDRFDDQPPGGLLEAALELQLLKAAVDQVVAQIRGALLRELADPVVEPPRDRRPFQGLVEQPPEELHHDLVWLDALPRQLRDLRGDDRFDLRGARPVRWAPAVVEVLGHPEVRPLPPRRARELQREEHLDAPVELAAGRRRVLRRRLELAAALGDDLDPRRDAAGGEEHIAGRPRAQPARRGVPR